MKKEKREIEQAKQYMKEHYQKRDLSEEEVSREIDMMPSCFSNMFKQVTGQTYISYLRGVRMEAAAKMLRETDQKNYVIARKVGIEDPNYFSFLFKKQYGVSPSTYRERRVVFCVQKKADEKEMLIRQAKKYIEKNYQNPELSAKTVSEELNISRIYFSSIFRKVTGQTYVSYLKEIRMRVAAQLLEETQEKAWVIAQSVGFEDCNYFSFAFKKYYGISPSKYREIEQNEELAG